MRKNTAVVAVGGNAILRAGENGSVEAQLRNLEITARYLATMVEQGYDIVITHGNGPQVGNILLQNEMCRELVPPMPLDVCVAESQGQIGYLLQQVVSNELRARGLNKIVVSMITQVVVDAHDEAFRRPTKPIGPYYNDEEAKELIRKKGWKLVRDDARGGWRRLVPSPLPIRIVEAKLIKDLRDSGAVVIAAGGGGVPVVEKNGKYVGVEAVVDKDLASAILARSIGENLLIILTDVAYVALNFGTPLQQNLGTVGLSRIRAYYAEGHFPPGSMGPKIKAAIDFLENGGERVIITSPENLYAALNGKSGTIIVRE